MPSFSIIVVNYLVLFTTLSDSWPLPLQGLSTPSINRLGTHANTLTTMPSILVIFDTFWALFITLSDS